MAFSVIASLDFMTKKGKVVRRMWIGKNVRRVDGYAKVTGEAKYTQDYMNEQMLVGKVLHSTIANGVVKSFDLEAALKVPGVVRIVTCFEVPDIEFGTPGHPWSLEESHQDVQDRRLLNQRVRYYGDDIAAVLAENDLAAQEALRKIKVEYEVYAPIVDVFDAMKEDAPIMHAPAESNILKHTTFRIGEKSYEEWMEEEKEKEELFLLDKTYDTRRVSHCHLELPVSYAYQDENRKITVVTSTQIPHIVRRVVAQALGMPWGQIRIIKPYIGGGFGNKQDVLYEPLNAYLCMLAGGRPVKMELSREETFVSTRTRHAIRFHVQAAVKKDGTLVARKLEAFSNQGGYASHGHAIVANAANLFKQLYQDEKGLEADCYTVYTSAATAGAMRGYGIPQGAFATECMIDDLAVAIGMDPLQFRLKNCVKAGYKDPHNGITFHSYGLKECIRVGREKIDWDHKYGAYQGQQGMIRKGIGMAAFCYKTGVHPISLETASCRMVLNQDGSVQMMLGATEIGQGADTVFSQMAAETLGISVQKVYVLSTQDTEYSPFDTGAYASRQTYVTGKAILKTAGLLKEKILDYGQWLLKVPKEALEIAEDCLINKEEGTVLLTLEELATTALYHRERSEHMAAEATSHCKENSFASGVCFAEVEVDMALGKIKILRLMNIHDSGVIINPQLAKAQVHGGMSMGIGYALSEVLLYDETGKPLNGNLLDYKLPTMMDTPKLEVEFVELEDPTGPYGNKALGEPPAIPVAPAIRNAVLHATGVAFDALPLDPETLVKAFLKREGGVRNVSD